MDDKPVKTAYVDCISKSIAGIDNHSDRTANVVVQPYELMHMFYQLELAVAHFHHTDETTNYNYIPYPHLTFLEELSKEKPKSFLEVGCGLGTKLFIAKNWLKIPNVTGLEIVRDYVQIAKRMCSEASVIEIDANEFDKYHEFDIVYSYTPQNRENTDKLYAIIKEKMKPGAIFLQAVCNGKIRKWVKPNGD